jgi:GTP-binding protein
MPAKLSSVVLVGRPNVGKSTLFNRLTRTRRSIVTAVAGTTRDVITREATRDDANFELVDTGGMFGESQDPLHELVLERGKRAIQEADLLVLVVDGRVGLVPGDEDIAAAVRARGVPVFLAINKTDDHRAKAGALEFYAMGFSAAFELSAEHGDGVGELAEAIAITLKEAGQTGVAADTRGELRVAIIGRPNAGKSSLANRLLREERMIVSEVPGTTRDTVDAPLTWHHRHFRIFDTAGIRRPGRVVRGGQVESLSVLLARRAIEDADVVVLVIDAANGGADQDATIAGIAEKAGCAVLIVANKWDLMKGRGERFSLEFDDALRQHIKFLEFAPILHVSAETGERLPKLLEAIDRVGQARQHRVTTGALNKFIAEATAAHPPVSPGHKHVRIMYAAQTGTAPPSFVFFTNVATTFHFSYLRYLVNQLREKFGFEGTPIRLHIRKRGADRPVARAKR